LTFTHQYLLCHELQDGLHIFMEQHTSNKLIRPLSKYRGADVREVMLLNQR